MHDVLSSYPMLPYRATHSCVSLYNWAYRDSLHFWRGKTYKKTHSLSSKISTECVLYRMCSLQNVFSVECVLYRMCSTYNKTHTLTKVAADPAGLALSVDVSCIYVYMYMYIYMYCTHMYVYICMYTSAGLALLATSERLKRDMQAARVLQVSEQCIHICPCVFVCVCVCVCM